MKLLQSKPIITQKSIHTSDTPALVEFLNTHSKELKSIDNLGSFIDITNIKHDYGVDIAFQFLIVQRNRDESMASGEIYSPEEGPRYKDVYMYPYNLPKHFPESEINGNPLIESVVKRNCKPTTNCPECNGSKECQRCMGSGKVICTSCRGEGKKSINNGRTADGRVKTKKVACHTCNGSGKTYCDVCEGKKKCQHCSGSGQVACRLCDGEGVYQDIYYIATIFKSISKSAIVSQYDELSDVLPKTTNSISFDGLIVEWASAVELSSDRRDEVAHINQLAGGFLENLHASSGADEGEKVGRVYAKLKNIPITTIDYTFEDKEYSIRVVGENNIVCYYEIPKQHNYKAGIFTRIKNVFNKKQRQIAFLYIAAYIFHVDDEVDPQEQLLLDILLEYIFSKHSERSEYALNIRRKLSFEEIKPYISCVRKDPRSLTFAWQCLAQDKRMKPAEVAAIQELAAYFGMNFEDVLKYRKKAEKFSAMNKEQLLTEYFR